MTTIREVLQELVAAKDVWGRTSHNLGDDSWQSKQAKQRYDNAWEAARAALAAPAAPQDAQITGGCGYPYCGGDAPECATCQSKRQLAAAPAVLPEPVAPAIERYNKFMGDTPLETEPDPVERLRFFCSLAISGQDWIDVEPFFDALTHPAGSSDAPSPLWLSKLPSMDPAWSDEIKDGWMRCFRALQAIYTPPALTGQVSTPAQGSASASGYLTESV